MSAPAYSLKPVKPVVSADVRRRRQVATSVITASVIVHLVAAVGAGVFVVARYFSQPPAQFEVKKDIRLPAQEREHRMNLAEFDAMTPKPTFNEKLASLRPTNFSLPDLPQIPMDQMLPLDPAAIVSDQVSSLIGAAGTGSGGLGGGGLGGTGKGASFFGIESNGTRILLLYDVSQSVLTKLGETGLEEIKKETMNLLDKLPISARFGMVQFTQNYKPFSTELMPATDQNRAAAREWIDKEWVTAGQMPSSARGVTANPLGLGGVLQFAGKLEPDVVFILSDGDFYWRPQGGITKLPWSEITKALNTHLGGTRSAKVHFIGFQVKPEHSRELRRVFRATGGKVREVR